MKTKSRSRSRCAIQAARWASYAVAGAATAMTASNDAEATFYYSGIRDIPANAAQPYDRITTLGSHHRGSGPPGIGTQTIAQIGSGNGDAHMTIVGNARHAPLQQRFAGYSGKNYLGSYGYAGKFALGASIAGKHLLLSSPPGPVPNDFVSLAYKSSYKHGGHSQWHPAGIGFLLFEFNRGGGEQYGWARLDMLSGPPGNTYELVDWAFGSVGQAITAGEVPEPATLGLLAVGAAGLLAYRRSHRRKARSAVN